jgi:hypothetical protein
VPVIALLDRTGLRTAAWITLQWLAHVTGRAMPADIMSALAPGPARRHWLDVWIGRDLPSRLLRWPALIQVGFTLPAHDRAGDAWRMLTTRSRGPRAADREKRPEEDQAQGSLRARERPEHPSRG